MVWPYPLDGRLPSGSCVRRAVIRRHSNPQTTAAESSRLRCVPLKEKKAGGGEIVNRKAREGGMIGFKYVRGCQRGKEEFVLSPLEDTER